MNPWKLRTIDDALRYCQNVVRSYSVEMSPKDKEGLAAQILGFSAGDYFAVWRKDYPIIDEIQATAADLSWSNAIDVDEDWKKLIKCINELARQVASSASSNNPAHL